MSDSKNTRDIVLGVQEMEDILFAISVSLNSGATLAQKLRLSRMYDRFEYLCTHDEKGAPVPEQQKIVTYVVMDEEDDLYHMIGILVEASDNHVVLTFKGLDYAFENTTRVYRPDQVKLVKL
jgi:hypothetical protein